MLWALLIIIFAMAFWLAAIAPQSNLESAQVADKKHDESEGKSEETIVEYSIDEYASNLEVPWGMVFTSDSRMLVTERPGRLRVIEGGILKAEPLKVFPEVSTSGEEGLMSVELDPDYENNKWIYLSLAYKKGSGINIKIVRYTDAGDRLEDETVIMDFLPAAKYHAGCRLAFGPDGKLYVSIGDALEREQAQNKESLAGKILRINKDGSIPADNPFENSPVWSYGHRNPQGIDWSQGGLMYATEHGPSIFDGPTGGDELNYIVKGANYGWPLVSHDKSTEGAKSPIIQFTPSQPPGSLLAYSGKSLPQFAGHLFFGSLKGEGLMHIIIDESDPEKVISAEKMSEVKFGRIRNVIEGPDGAIYFSTSNRDGRGNPEQKDDRIFRISPKASQATID